MKNIMVVDVVNDLDLTYDENSELMEWANLAEYTRFYMDENWFLKPESYIADKIRNAVLVCPDYKPSERPDLEYVLLYFDFG